MPSPLTSLDGADGQTDRHMVRACLVLSSALGEPVRMTNLDHLPDPPTAEDLAVFRVLAELCGAGGPAPEEFPAALTCDPKPPSPGAMRVDLPAGVSVPAVMECVAPVLAVARGEWDLVLTGGTHTPAGPCFEYVRDVYAVLASIAGVSTYWEMPRAGFQPAGGGRVRLQIRGLGQIENLGGLRLRGRGELKYIEGLCAASCALPDSMTDRQTTQVLGRLAATGHRASVEHAVWDTDSPGTCVFLRGVFGRSVAGFHSLGVRGMSVDQVADHAADQLLAFLDAEGELDPHAAMQMTLLAGVSCQASRFGTSRITRSLLSTARAVERMTGRTATIDGTPGRPGHVTVDPR